MSTRYSKEVHQRWCRSHGSISSGFRSYYVLIDVIKALFLVICFRQGLDHPSPSYISRTVRTNTSTCFCNEGQTRDPRFEIVTAATKVKGKTPTKTSVKTGSNVAVIMIPLITESGHESPSAGSSLPFDGCVRVCRQARHQGRIPTSSDLRNRQIGNFFK